MAHHPIEDNNPSSAEHFNEVVDRARLSRRGLIRGGVGLAALSTLPFLKPGAEGTAAAHGIGPYIGQRRGLGFDAVSKSLLDDVVLPEGYTYTVVHATGDRLDTSVPAYSNSGAEKDDWTRRVGDHHDGMDIFYVDRWGRYSDRETGRAVLVVNHESSADAHFFHPTGQTSNGVTGKKFSQFGGWDLGARPELEALKEINHHGVSIVEIALERGRRSDHERDLCDDQEDDGKGRRRRAVRWTYKLNSPYNRRINGQTPMRIAGPAKHLKDIQAFMVTRFDPTGAKSRGTLNNCGHGKTPWGTYLACEENWAFYFTMPKGSNPVDSKIQASRARYGVARVPLADAATSATTQGWNLVDGADPQDLRFARWDISARGASAAEDFRNEPNTFGYNVEIDPLSKDMPAKRVAMGRFAHEAAVCSEARAGRPLAFYMGCDSQNEYIYKFVTAAKWDPRDEGRGLKAGDKYLNEGRLYVAKFSDDGTGEWIELTIDNPLIANYATYPFANQADVLVNARHAATAVGATRMDRPEWGAINPRNGDIYMTMTNNSSRTAANTDASNPRAYRDADGRGGATGNGGNPNGHIVRFKEEGRRPDSMAFEWDIFLFGAEADSLPEVNLSGLTDVNDFSSPDGLWFSQRTGICWIQTDDGAYTDETNCMLLAAIPGQVGDGEAVTVQNSLNGVTGSQNTFIGAALGEARLRRFLVGPKGCEITGLTESADGRTLFVNIQHPGELTPALGAGGGFVLQSQWPGVAEQAYGPTGRPRSATIAIRRKDGGVIGL